MTQPSTLPATEVTKECLTAVMQLRCVPDGTAVDVEQFRERLMGMVDTVRDRSRKAGLSQRDAADVQYAIVAVIDEVASRKGGVIAEAWMQRPLQLHYFNSNVAGERFFSQLDALLKDPRRSEVLRVYYLCLLAGFEGRYAHSGNRMELDSVAAQTREALGEWVRPPGISARPNPPRESQEPRRRPLPWLWAATMVGLFSISMTIALMGAMDQQLEALVADLEAMISE